MDQLTDARNLTWPRLAPGGGSSVGSSGIRSSGSGGSGSDGGGGGGATTPPPIASHLVIRERFSVVHSHNILLHYSRSVTGARR